jgi:hypothetical protein
MLVINDRCYSGAFRQRGDTSINLANMSRVQFLDEVSLRQSRNLLTSDANEPVADGGGREHSIFAQALLDGLALEH